jgi:flagellar basal-body rod protein FlgB
MLNRLFSAGSLPALESMLTYASRRQRVIATNIANVDTVGFKTRDLAEPDFRKQLAQAFSPREGLAADAGSLKPGGNNVDLEIEMAKMVKNSALHSTVATLLANQFMLLREAIAGHVIS